MFTLTQFTLVLVLCAGCVSIVNSKSVDQTAEFLWNLSNLALQSRQNYRRLPYPYSYKYPGKYPQYYQNYPANSYMQYPGSTYPPVSQDPYDYLGKPVLHTNRPFRQTLENTRQSFMDVLFSIARNDDLQCVPKIICEVTSGAISGRQQGVNLPININMESLLSFFSTLNGVQLSPLLHFGKAALQGYTSKGNTGSCNYAYPDCPSDPDKLVQYLNNHNGGFFRYFGGVNPQSYPLNYNPNFKGKSIAEQRIQTNPVNYAVSNFRQQKEVRFPVGNQEEPLASSGQKQLRFPSEEDFYNNEVRPNTDDDFLYQPQGVLKFPNEEAFGNFGVDKPFRRPKELLQDTTYYYQDNELDLQKPLPNHKATPLIFPVRTGTGDLRLDADELEEHLSYGNDAKITFNGFGNQEIKDQIRFTKNSFGDSEYGRGGRDFIFPTR